MAGPKQANIIKELEPGALLIACVFDPKGRWLFPCPEDGSVVRWELETGMKSVLAGHNSWPVALAPTPDGETLISAGRDDSLLWWPAVDAEPKPSRTVRAHDGWISMVAVSPDGVFDGDTGEAAGLRCQGHNPWRQCSAGGVGSVGGGGGGGGQIEGDRRKTASVAGNVADVAAAA